MQDTRKKCETEKRKNRESQHRAAETVTTTTTTTGSDVHKFYPFLWFSFLFLPSCAAAVYLLFPFSTNQ